MDNGKYIIVEYMGHEVAIVFDSLISHSDFMPIWNRDKIVSAGMFSTTSDPTENDPYDISVAVWGKSITTNKESRKGTDEKLIKRILRKEEKW